MNKVLLVSMMLIGLSVSLAPAVNAGSCPWSDYGVRTTLDHACSDQSTDDPVGYAVYCAEQFVNESWDGGIPVDYLAVWCPTKILNGVLPLG